MPLPASKSAFSTRAAGQTIRATDANALQAAVEGVEDTVGVNAQGAQADVAARLTAIETAAAGIGLGRGLDFGLPGVIAPSMVFATASQTVASGTLYGGLWVAPRAMTLTRLAFGVPTAMTADDPFEWALYSADLTTRVFTTGSLTGASAAMGGTGGLNATGTKRITLPTPGVVTDGTLYNLVFLRTGAGTTGQVTGTGGQAFVSAGPGSTAGLLVQWTVTGQTIPLAANISALTLAAASNVPLCWLLEG